MDHETTIKLHTEFLDRIIKIRCFDKKVDAEHIKIVEEHKERLKLVFKKTLMIAEKKYIECLKKKESEEFFNFKESLNLELGILRMKILLEVMETALITIEEAKAKKKKKWWHII